MTLVAFVLIVDRTRAAATAPIPALDGEGLG